MRRFAVLLSAAIVMFSNTVVLSGPTVIAQEAATTEMAEMATHPVVGMWELTGQITADNTFPILAIFHADGTYLEIYPWGTVFFGVWKPTGERTAEGTTVAYEFIDDRLLRGEGRWTAEVDEAGNTIATDGPFVALCR